MTDNNNDNNHFSIPYLEGLAAVPHTRAIIARELRRMAAAEGPYKRFTYLTPRIKAIWGAAADIIEEDSE